MANQGNNGLIIADDLGLLSEEYEVVDHRLKLFLDVEVFEEEEEELHSFLKVRRGALKALRQEIICHKSPPKTTVCFCFFYKV